MQKTVPTHVHTNMNEQTKLMMMLRNVSLLKGYFQV